MCKLPDIKDENIMVTIEREALLNSFARYQKNNPQPGHVRKEDGRTTYYSQGNFGPLRGSRLVPKLSDFDLAFNGGPAHMSPIQSNFFRAPEVMLGGSWSYSVDIWNLGLLVSKTTASSNDDADMGRCGTSWKIELCARSVANTTHTSTSPSW